MNLEVETGEYFVLIGPTGAGKSILLETIAGLYRPKKGFIEVDGIDITGKEPRRREIGIVYQDYMLFPHLTVIDNVRFGMKGDEQLLLDNLLDLLDISQILSRKPDNLSGGESQRVALARALVTRPKILLLDEPLSALDINTRESIISKLKEINESLGVTIIHITHERLEATSLADRVAVMNKGEILQVGRPEDVFRRPDSEFVANFVGCENLYKGRSVIDPDTGIADVEVGGVTITATTSKSDDVFITIRPEDILISIDQIETSGRNSYHGKITEVKDMGNITRIIVDVGILFSVVLTKRSFEDLFLGVGKGIYITFKASSVHVF
ncbi:MAG: ABC transporter ATP-binding protein [Halobacteriota archaeon]|nr:ABC transporter ATP-binding protein [Halobacteriota archaeon]